MVIKKLLCFFFLTSFFANAQHAVNSKDLVEYINPLMGTASSYDLSNGNTYPTIGLPWGMNAWTPQTGNNGNGWQYTYDAKKIRGFKQTHQPSPWMNDYGQFSLMPIVRKGTVDEEDQASWFSHKSEIAKPYYYSVYLADHDVTTEITPTERAAFFHFTFPKTDSAFVVIDAFDRGSYIKIIPEENKIIGYSTRYARGKLSNFKNYFVIVFDKPFKASALYNDKTKLKELELSGSHMSALINFDCNNSKEIVGARVASSFISFEQAEINLKEIGDDTFLTVKQKAKDTWNKTLGRIQVESGTEEQIRTFYSTFYRTLFFPMKMYEIDASNKIIHYSPYSGKVMPGYRFAGTGFWDTFRALYPFLNLMYPSINKEMQQGLLNDYLEGGWLPEWSSPSYSDIMIGNNSASVVSDAYIKGLRGYDINKLYEALVHGANNEGPQATGRKGVEYYNKLGYVPYDVGINENAARTLEYAYDDFTISRLAKALNRPQEEIDLYEKRSMNYTHLFDSETNLMRGKNKDGSFHKPFNPFKWGDEFTEGNSWHYTWSVFHDIAGLSKLMGGNKKFVSMLDSVFTMPPVFDNSYYGETIHEIREMQIANMGQYAHGNQPIQHMIYLYNYAGEPWKTQYWVREVMNRLYKPTPDGYCGDEDNGQTSAWYVFSALGFYPVCPATNEYVLGTPLFKKVTLTLENGKQFVITAPNNNLQNIYIQKVDLNGKEHLNNWISHETILNGGTFNFKMSDTPNKKRGTTESSFPFSLSTTSK
ncbi:GH92 family glycosyl hydrolase [Flavobacterium aquatile]|uniref:Alpha-mannosidase n=1 Tax=Flavobacterium aquatile LMG 4008 = ATCC 11947 TaxID=1453498 RepID=A0A095UZ23_9FLAO|nr:GH92 family glycosyl hydrolase [Flavobacterium aquatile]KGD67830.1 alpha-mannosidase [Flavobacterium aquatile LMG 4008 = ATCC 11947]OXA67692.1 alpha-mannosidase [Flavobacterium aquatile] [Flavobacterium aquatile LMG 4008 = ATCC 11947]GEC78329.1 alpha-1 2-mannosidase [Flavobacterium aquatile]